MLSYKNYLYCLQFYNKIQNRPFDTSWILNLSFFRYDVENNTIQSIPDPLPRQDVAEVPQPPKENLRILCCAISQNSEFVAFADDHKQVTGCSLSDQHILSPIIQKYKLLRNFKL